MEPLDPMQDVRPAKRARSLESEAFACDVALAQQHEQLEESSVSLLSLPDGVVYQVLAGLPSSALVALNSVCRYFRTRDGASGLRLTHRLAKEAVVRMAGERQAGRWRNYNWLQRLAIEETVTLFDRDKAVAQEFAFKEAAGSMTVTEIKLEKPGPRMLLSDVSTEQSPILRWKLQLRGNNAAEFGVVPVDMQDSPKALHKCQPNPMEERATGFSSAITVGSLLPARMPIMKGTVVEILVTPGEVAFIINNPEDGAEMIWQNNSTVSRLYKGPRELKFQLPCTYRTPVKLAVTAWQRAAFEVLHTQPPNQQQALPANAAAAPAPCKAVTAPAPPCKAATAAWLARAAARAPAMPPVAAAEQAAVAPVAASGAEPGEEAAGASNPDV